MKKIVFPLAGMIMLAFSSCIEKGDNIQTFNDGVAAVVAYSDLGQPALKTYQMLFLAPELNNLPDLYYGDPVLAYFEINYDNQPSTDHYTISNLTCIKIGTAWPYSSTGGESLYDDFPEKVENAFIYDQVGNILFLGVQLTGAGNQVFECELTYDQDEEVKDNTPTLYLKAKKSGTGSGTASTYNYPYTFNLSDVQYFLSPYKNSDNMVKVNINCKNSVDADGKDEYKAGTRTETYGIMIY